MENRKGRINLAVLITKKHNTMEQKIVVKPTEHTDVRGKKLLYIVIFDENDKTQEPAVINVGQKTYDAVNNIVSRETKKK